MSERIKAKFNDREYEFDAGLTVLQAAETIGIEIPHFCYHKCLSISGNCRMCLVDVKPGPPKPSIACGTMLTDGMDVHTDTDEIRKARKGVLEFLLLNHPLDCPVCDEAYECKLQDYVYEYGAQSSRSISLHDKKRVYKRVSRGKLFLEMDRCIECTRCVRYFEERAGCLTFERMHRGHKLKIDTMLENIDSPFTLNAADLCPVGAMEDRKFRFKARNWDLLRVPTVCSSCSIGCNIDIDSFKDNIKRILPRENEEVNSCFICDHGRHDFDFINDNRLAKAVIKKDAESIEVDFNAAIEKALSTIEEIKTLKGGESLAVLLSPKMTNEELYTGKLLANKLGVKRVGFVAGYNKRAIVPVLSDILPNTLVSDDKTANSTGGRLLDIAEGEESFSFAHELLTAIEDGEINGLILFHEDLLALANTSEADVRRAIAKLDFLMLVSSNPLKLAGQADVVLPCLTYAEKNGSFTNHQRRVQRIRPVIKPLDGVKSELEVLTRLGRHFEDGFGFDKAEDAFADMAKNEARFAGMSFAGLGEFGVVLENN